VTRAAMGAAGRLRVIDQFSVETMVARTVDVYSNRVVQSPASVVQRSS